MDTEGAAAAPDATPAAPPDATPAEASAGRARSSSTAQRAATERDAALVAQARLTDELARAEALRAEAEQGKAALQAEVEQLTNQVQNLILEKLAMERKPGASPYSGGKGKQGKQGKQGKR